MMIIVVFLLKLDYRERGESYNWFLPQNKVETGRPPEEEEEEEDDDGPKGQWWCRVELWPAAFTASPFISCAAFGVKNFLMCWALMSLEQSCLSSFVQQSLTFHTVMFSLFSTPHFLSKHSVTISVSSSFLTAWMKLNSKMDPALTNTCYLAGRCCFYLLSLFSLTFEDT